MKTSKFNYSLPENLIAQQPVFPRDSSRLLVLDSSSGKISHHHFCDIVDYLEKGDVLVLNNSKVIPARLFGEVKGKDGKRAEILLVRKTGPYWECLAGGKKLKVGDEIVISPRFSLKIRAKNPERTFLVKFNKSGVEFKLLLLKHGHTPTPPYIKYEAKESDYQTIYAAIEGSVAAPTVGLHFTKGLLEKLKAKGVAIEFVTLHVGLGTFLPVKEENLEDHKIHVEYASLSLKTAEKLNKAKREKRRIIAVGTTTVRVLESTCDNNGRVKPFSGEVDIFIKPGYKFKVVDAMITNFHLPASTLLALVCAFGRYNYIMRAYKIAIKNKYRFYSFGDAMFLK